MEESGPEEGAGGSARRLRGLPERLRGLPFPPGRLGVAAVAAVVVIVAVIAVAAGRDGKSAPVGTAGAAQSLGPGEGALSLVTWPGYVENGANDPRVDWVAPFEQRTKCKVTLKEAASAQEMTGLMSSSGRRYDGVSAPPEVAGQLVATGQAAPVNPDLVDGYKRLEPRLRTLLKRDDKVFGVPFVWGADLLMYDPKTVAPPTSWAAVFDPAEARKYSRRITMRDTPLTLAEAALYLKSKKKSLDITDPYALTREQLDAAAKVIRTQRPHVKSYWQQPADPVSAFAGGDAVLGEVWPYHLDVLSRAGRSVAAATPKEGLTGWASSWMIGARVEHPNCMYQWLKWTASPDVQQQVAEWAGVAPANPEACTGDRLKSTFCAAYHVGDRAYINRLAFARTLTKDCGGGRRDCTDYTEWTKAWQEATRQ